MRTPPATLRAAAALATLIAGAAPLHAQCEGGRWSDAFATPHFIDGAYIVAARVLDIDGPGPLPEQLILGGDSNMSGSGLASGHPFSTSKVQRWDGRVLLPLSRINDPNGTVRDFAAFDIDGSGPGGTELYCFGQFASPLFGFLVRLRDGVWESAARLTSGTPLSMTVVDDDGDGPLSPLVYVGGSNLKPLGATTTSGVVVWDGENAFPLLGGEAPTNVFTVLFGDPDGDGGVPPSLFAAGYRFVDGVTTHGVFMWDGETWALLGGSFSSVVRSLALFDQDGPFEPEPLRLVAVGGFQAVGGVPLPAIGIWDGSSWAPLARPLAPLFPSDFDRLCVFDFDADGPLIPQLVGGSSTGSGGSFRVLTDGGAGPPSCSLRVSGGRIAALCALDPDGTGPERERLLVAGNYILDDPSGPDPRGGALLWDGCNWSKLHRELDHDILIAGGAFRVSSVVRDPTTPPGEPSRVIVAGEFDLVRGAPIGPAVLWDGSDFLPMDGDLGWSVSSVVSLDPDDSGPEPPAVFAVSSRPANESEPATSVFRWDGSRWDPIQPPLDAGVVVLAGCQSCAGEQSSPRLFALQSIAGAAPSACRVLAWDGDSWAQVGDSLLCSNSTKAALLAFPSDGNALGVRLVIASPKPLTPTVGDPSPCAFAEWDGAGWAPLAVVPSVCDSVDPNYTSVIPSIALAPGTPLAVGEGSFLWAPTGVPRPSKAIYRAAQGMNSQFDLPPLPVSRPGILGFGYYDPDGAGPRARMLLAGAMDYDILGMPSIWSNDDGVWVAVDEPVRLAVPSSFAEFDHDGDGPAPPSLIVGHGSPGVLLQSGQESYLPGFLREWIPNIPATLIESPHSLIVRPGDSASFKVLAVGTDASIAWRKDTAPLPDGALATERSWIISIDNATVNDRGLYDAVITNACGEVTSSPAELRIRVLEGDANADTVVDFTDITDALANWGADYDAATGPGDADNDGTVTMNDLTAVLKNWLARE